MLVSMDLKRLASPEPFLTPRRKLILFSLGVAAYLMIFTVFLNNNSAPVPKVKVFLEGFDGVGANSSCSSWRSSVSTNFSSSSSSSTANATSNSVSQQYSVISVRSIEEGSVVGNTSEASLSDVRRNDNKKLTLEGMGLKTTPLRNFTENINNTSLHAGEQRVQQKSHEENGTLVTEKGNFLDSNGQGIASGKSRVENSSVIVKVTSLGEENRNTTNTSRSSEARIVRQKTMEGEPLKNSSLSTIMGTEVNNVANISYKVKHAIEAKNEGDSIEKRNVSFIHHDSPPKKKQIGFYKDCDIFDGKWVRDYSKPYYPSGSCPHIDRDFNCHLNGRPDGEYVKWKWQPNGCDIPSLNATDFLERLRGQRLVFVGDSLNRNMWESMVCIFHQSIRDKKRVYEISGRTEFKKKGVYAFRFEDYNCSVDFVASPFIVRESTFEGKNGSFETLRLDLMDRTTTMYHDADIIVFNTGHWWTHEKTSRGQDYYQEGNRVHPKLEVLDAYRRALTTWARWIDRNIDAYRTQVFFRGYSVTHFSGGQWNSGGQCHKETEPIFNETYLQAYPTKMRVVEQVILKMRTPVVYMNVSRLTDYRKDGHPSIYRMIYKSEAERNSAERYQDCSHWCLPGVPDAWNELLYVSLLKHGKGTWKS